MSISVVPSAYGRPASERLHRAVADAKHAEPLAPVTVVVPTNSVGVAARRLLAAGELGPVSPNGTGVVGVTFVTVYRLAELLGAPRLSAQQRRPVSTAVIGSIVRRVLTERAGIFSPVASHPATTEALISAYRELSDLDEAQLDQLASQNVRVGEIVRVHRAVRTRIAASWYDEHDLMNAARDAVAHNTPLLRDLGTIVCFLPQRWSGPAARLLRALADHTKVTVIAALTGDAHADAAVVSSLARVDLKLDDDTLSSVQSPAATRVVSASDSDDEIRIVMREVVDAMRAGVPLERMAVLYGPDEPYARLVHEHLQLAGIAYNGVSPRRLADTVFGRALLRLLALADGRFARDDVFGVFAAAPVLDGRGTRVPVTEWERVSRRAGIVGGIDEWRARLDVYAASLRDDGWDARERARAEDLRACIDVLATEVAPDATRTTWRAYARWTHRLARRFLGDDDRRADWPRVEQDAARRVEAAIDRLAGLDAVDDPPTLDVFRRALKLELDAARDRVGRLGEGLLAGPIGFALGVELDRVWVCGLAEGVFPAAPHDDALLADRDRDALDGELRRRAERVHDDHRAVLAAFASTTTERVCTWPRGDLRRSTEHVPSRFVSGPTTKMAASFVHSLTANEFPATRHEVDVRRALAHDATLLRDADIARGQELLAARASDEFTRFDGNLSLLGERLGVISPLDHERPVAPTRLELWADCPHAYFMQSVLHVETVDRPEVIMQLAPIDRGALVHGVLDRFLRLPVDERDRDGLRAIALDACAAIEGRGLTGRRLLWERDRRVILSELDAFFDANTRFAAARGATTIATEHPFGLARSQHPPVELCWPDGRSLRMRGQADRIDVAADGTLLVIDYKTGSPDPYSPLTSTHLQLPVYARAAAAFRRDDHAPIEAYYWFVGRGNNRLIGYAVDDEVDAEFMRTVRGIADAIEAGVFVARPAVPSPQPFVPCRYCDPDALGTADRWREWERKYDAPELAAYRVLVEGEL